MVPKDESEPCPEMASGRQSRSRVQTAARYSRLVLYFGCVIKGLSCLIMFRKGFTSRKPTNSIQSKASRPPPLDSSDPPTCGPLVLPSAPLTGLAEFEQTYGGPQLMQFEDASPMPNFMWHAARAFFENGGTHC